MLSGLEGETDVYAIYNDKMAYLKFKTAAQVKPSEIAKKLTGKYSAVDFFVAKFPGTISAEYVFTSSGGQAFEMRRAKDEKGKEVELDFKKLALKNDKGEPVKYLVKGKLLEERFKEKDGKEKIRYVIEMSELPSIKKD